MKNRIHMDTLFIKNCLSVTLMMFLFLSNNLLIAQPLALDELLNNLASHPDVKRGTVALSVYDVESKQPVYQYNGNQLVKPASIFKLITTGFALDYFAEDYRIKTVLGYNGKITDGVLQGDIVVHGYGDPTFGSARFGEIYTLPNILNQFMQAIFQSGIHQIEGNIIVDGSAFDTAVQSPKWLWEDIGNYYGAGAGGFNVLENQYTIEFQSGETGSETEIISTQPTIKDLKLFNEVTAGEVSSGDNAYVFGAPFTDVQFVRGTIPPNKSSFTIKAAIPNPALFFANKLKAHLRNNSITCNGSAKAVYTQKGNMKLRDQLYTHYSPALKEIVYHTNYKSINLYAECLLKLLAAGCNTTGNVNTGLTTLENYFKDKGFVKEDYQLYDGSGLSPVNLVTTDFFARNLVELYQAENKEAWLTSLSIAGNPDKGGYLKNMLKNTKAANNLKAKSGYMQGVRSYAGFVKDGSDRNLAFTLIVNNYTCPASEMRKLMEPVLEALAELVLN